MADEDRIIFCGSFSTGLAAKIANNYIACSNMAIVAEAFAMGMANGVDRKVLFEAVRKSSGASWVLENAQPVPGLVPGPAGNKYEVSFLMPMIIKDVSLGVEMANHGETPAKVGETVLELYKAANNDIRCKVSGHSEIKVTVHSTDTGLQDLDCTSVWLHVSDCKFDPEFQK